MISLLGFVRENLRFLLFGLLLTFFSSFGQTFLIALFSAEIREALDLSHGGFGSLYALATLCSAATLVWVGRRIDDLDLRLYASGVCLGMVLGCAVMAAAHQPWLLLVAIYLLRLSGQGLMTHTALTSMARYFATQRGKAVSIASMGQPAGEAVLPVVLVAMVAAIGWRQTWLVFGGCVLAVLLPAIWWLLRGHERRHARMLQEASAQSAKDAAASAPRQWTRGEVLRDPRFYLVVPAVLAPAFIVTGVFFHQVHLVESKGWALRWFAASFVWYAAATVLTSLTMGILIDRWGVHRLLPFFLLPLAAALLLLALGGHPLIAVGFMVLAGVSIGAGSLLSVTLWAEVYGVRHLGAIRALTSACMVFSTALAPVVMGWLIDRGVGMPAILLGLLGYVVTVLLLLQLGARRYRAAARPTAGLTAEAELQG